MSAEQALKDRLRSFHADWTEMNFGRGEKFYEVWDEYFCDECQVIRPSGNPLDKESWRKLVSSPDVTYNGKAEDHKIVSVDSLVVFADGKAAVMTFTMDISFDYKGTQNEDRAKVSLAWSLEEGGRWKIIHFHRATGQPIPKEE